MDFSILFNQFQCDEIRHLPLERRGDPNEESARTIPGALNLCPNTRPRSEVEEELVIVDYVQRHKFFKAEYQHIAQIPRLDGGSMHILNSVILSFLFQCV